MIPYNQFPIPSSPPLIPYWKRHVGYTHERRTLLSVWPCNKVNVNGALLASRADTVGSLTVNANWHIGSSNGNSRFFDGEIREVAIWDSALNAAQAAAVYAGTAPSEDYATSVTAYTYDALNRLTSLTDPVGNTTSYTYDYRGLVLTETNEKNATRYYTYDTLGRLVSKTDRNNRVTTYTYDSVGRLTSEHWGNTTDYFMYTYDLVGNLLYATDGDHSYSYTYDSLYRPTHVSFNFDSQSAVFSYTYDLAGRQTSSSLTLNGHSDRTISTEYDYLGNAVSIRQHGNAVDEIFAEFEHNANSLLTAINRYEEDENDVLTSVAESLYEYNANNAVTSITHNNASGSQIVQHSYTYDETNNIVEYLNSIDGSTSYDYDFLGQLISADSENQTDESYTYDANGNRIVANGDTYTTGDNNELTSDGTYTYTYDAEGNRTSKTNPAGTERELYTWDYRNRLTSVTQQEWDSVEQDWKTTQIVEYTYDYNNIWIRKTVGNNSTIFIPENYQTTVQIDNGAVSHHYLWTPNTQDKLLADTSTDGVSWSLADHLGTIRDVLDVNSSTHLIYDAFGNLISGTNPLLFGYTGKAFDPATKLQNNINRWYDPSIGRRLSTDPIGFEGNDTNLYRYVRNRVLVSDDPIGLDPSHFYTDPGLQSAQKNRETFEQRSRKEICAGESAETTLFFYAERENQASKYYPEHAYIQIGKLRENGLPLGGTSGVGIGPGLKKGSLPNHPERAFRPTYLQPLCRSASGKLSFGTGKGKCACIATDAEIADCLNSIAARKDDTLALFLFWKRYVCTTWAEEALSLCGLVRCGKKEAQHWEQVLPQGGGT